MSDEKLKPSDYIYSITWSKENLLEKDPLANAYSPYLTMWVLGSYLDCLPVIAQLNQFSFYLNSKQHYLYLLNSITKRKRFSKWEKIQRTEDDISLLAKYLLLSRDNAVQVLSFLPPEKLQELRDYDNTIEGGKENE